MPGRRTRGLRMQPMILSRPLAPFEWGRVRLNLRAALDLRLAGWRCSAPLSPTPIRPQVGRVRNFAARSSGPRLYLRCGSINFVSLQGKRRVISAERADWFEKPYPASSRITAASVTRTTLRRQDASLVINIACSSDTAS
jgi:hypothetical protein